MMKDNKFIACQGRSYDNNDFKLRYQTSKVHEDTQLIFGQDRLKSIKPKFAVEGIKLIHYSWIIVLPSLVLINLSCYLKIILSFQIMIEEIQMYLKSMKNLLEDGYSMVLWPDDIKEKDINDMIMSGKTKEEIKNDNTK